MADYPLILTLTFDIQGSDFLARVVTHGRALMTVEDGEWWCHGVDPGGLTSNGGNPPAAFAAYKRELSDILGDLAEETGTFQEFKRSVEAFVADTDRTEAQRWIAARDLIRAGTAVDAPFDNLKRVTDTVVTYVEVSSLDRVAASSDEVSLASIVDRVPGKNLGFDVERMLSGEADFEAGRTRPLDAVVSELRARTQ